MTANPVKPARGLPSSNCPKFWCIDFWALVTVQRVLLGWHAFVHSPTFNEIGHLPAGICHWRYQMFHLYRVNPPLPRMVASIPVLAMKPETDWSNYQLGPHSRETIPMGIRFAKVNGPRTFALFAVARLGCIPFALLGATVCWVWAGELWGRSAARLSLALWVFNPMILGHGSLVMPDVPAAATGAMACFLLRLPNFFIQTSPRGLFGHRQRPALRRDVNPLPG